MITNGGTVSEGMEADVVLSGRVWVDKVDADTGRVRLIFGDNIDEQNAAWVNASAIREVRPVTATAEMFVEYWKWIRELVEKADQHPNESRRRSILKQIDEIIDPKWMEERLAKLAAEKTR